MTFFEQLSAAVQGNINGIVANLQRLYQDNELTLAELETKLQKETGFASVEAANNEQLATAQAEVARLTTALEQANESLTGANESLTAISVQLETVNQSVADLQSTNAALTAERDAINAKFTALSAEFAEYKVNPGKPNAKADSNYQMPATASATDGPRVYNSSGFNDLK
jgi:chromosome segregation ATPase